MDEFYLAAFFLLYVETCDLYRVYFRTMNFLLPIKIFISLNILQNISNQIGGEPTVPYFLFSKARITTIYTFSNFVLYNTRINANNHLHEESK